MEILKDDLSNGAVIEFLEEHLKEMATHSPIESVHALDVQALLAPEITFWTAWQDSDLLGCAALKELGRQHGEIKSMRTARAHLGKGVASTLLTHLIIESGSRGLKRLSLETGSGVAFSPAHALYSKFGFVDCEPFADYVHDPYSRFFTRVL